MRIHDGNGHIIRPGFSGSVRSGLRAVVLTVTCIAGWPVPTIAQTTSSQPARSSPWDVTVAAGVLAGRPDLPDTDRYRDTWYDTGQAGLIVGRHLSTNLKVELELSTAAEGRQYVERYVTVPGVTHPVPYGTERFTTQRQLSGSLVWQFFENQWVHPFVQAGVSADVERVRSHTPAQSFYVGDPRLPGSRVVVTEERHEGPDTTTTAGLVLGSGAKLYATPHVFIRTDGRVTANGRGHHVAVRLGLGVDF